MCLGSGRKPENPEVLSLYLSLSPFFSSPYLFPGTLSQTHSLSLFTSAFPLFSSFYAFSFSPFLFLAFFFLFLLFSHLFSSAVLSIIFPFSYSLSFTLSFFISFFNFSIFFPFHFTRFRFLSIFFLSSFSHRLFLSFFLSLERVHLAFLHHVHLLLGNEKRRLRSGLFFICYPTLFSQWWAWSASVTSHRYPPVRAAFFLLRAGLGRTETHTYTER